MGQGRPAKSGGALHLHQLAAVEKSDPLQESGLLGPVTLQVVATAAVR
jgi:hypothetical protein